MDRNALLASTRAEFLRAFLNAVDRILPSSRLRLFQAADASFVAADQRRLLGAHRILTEHGAELNQQMSRSMDQLLNRSFQTTYSTFRPSFFSSYSEGGLSLVDMSLYEDQLRINEVTGLFRNAAEEQLRDLNIRVAILFEQDTINERENPFRPFLFARAIATAIDNMGQMIEFNNALFDQIAADIEPAIPGIYNAVNTLLADNGIAAQLQMKIQKSAPTRQDIAGFSNDDMSDSEADPFTGARRAHGKGNQGFQGGPDDASQGSQSRGNAPATMRTKVDQLMQSVKRLASAKGAPGRNALRGSQTGTNDVDTGGGYARSGGDGHGGRGGGGGGGPAGYGAGGDVSTFVNSRQAIAGGQGQPFYNGGGQPAYSGAPEASYPAGASSNPDLAQNSWGGGQSVSESLRDFFAVPASNSSFAGNTARYSGEFVTGRDVSVALDESLSGLMRDGIPTSEEMAGSDGDIRNLIFEQRSALSDASDDGNEQMTIDVVAMLFEFILRDVQIPAEVRAQLGRLQFLVLKIALRESTLLTQNSHPARLLVNRIGSISIGLKQLDPSGARVATEICRIVETLLGDHSGGSGIFERMLDEFDAFIANELRAGDANIDRTVQAVESAQNRTLHFAHLSAQLAESLTGLTIAPFLHEFLTDSWVHVIERTERADGVTSTRYRQLVPDLLWSILPKSASQDRSQLVRLLPSIVGSVRQGMALLGWDIPRQKPVLDWLVDAHSSAMRGDGNNASGLQLAALHLHFENFLSNAESVDMMPTLTDEVASPQRDAFLVEALEECKVQVEMLDPLIEQAKALPHDVTAQTADSLAQPDAISDQSVIERLLSGVAIEVTLTDTPTIGRLNWINQHVSTLILTMEGKSEPSMVSVRMFLRLQALGRVRFLESAPLFERAVKALLTSAELVDQQGE